MVAPAPSTPSSPAGPPAPGRSASRIASDDRGATEVLPEIAVFHHRANRRPEHAVAAPCIGRPRPHRRDTYPGRRRLSGQTRGGRYSWARYYHPQLSRFLSEDPIGFEGGDTDLYAYVLNAPTSLRDPTGLAVDPISWTAAAICRVALSVPPRVHPSRRRSSNAATHDPRRRDAGRARLLSPDALRSAPSGRRRAHGAWHLARSTPGALGSA